MRKVAFLKSVRDKNLSEVKRLLRSGVNVNTRVPHKDTALHLAAESCDFELARILLEDRKINVDALSLFGKTALHMAVDASCIKMVQLLLVHGANVNAVDRMKQAALHEAARSSNVDIARMLIHYGADVNAVNVFGETPISISVVYRPSPQMCWLLMEKGAVVNKEDKHLLYDAVLCASNESHRSAINYLIQYGANVNLRTPLSRRTAMHAAVLTNAIEVLETLFVADANPYGFESYDLSPLEFAIVCRHYKMALMITIYFPETLDFL